jgi:aerobic carbon-monoxide dehydrogenase medium subunit
MIPATFEYRRAGSLDEAVELLGTYPDGKLLAGGHSLIPMMKLRLAQPSVLIDIARLPDMRGIRHTKEQGRDRFTIGALTTHAEIAASEELRTFAPVLWEAANVIGDPQVRHRGTIGGACAHGDPSADFPAVMLAIDARFTLVGPNGTRDVKADDFFVGMFETALDAQEIVTSVAFDAYSHSAYEKLPHPASHYALVGVAVCLELDGQRITKARVALTGVGDSAFHAKRVESALAGCNVTDAKALEAASAGAADGVDARSEIEASARYRSAMADVYTERAVQRAASR